MGSPPRLHGLDGLRGIAALGIVVLHVWMWTGANDPHQNALLDRAIGELRLGVVLFFVLSGYLLARPWVAGRPPRLASFALRRAARIVPAYWLAVLGSFALLRGTGTRLEVDAAHLPVFALFLQNQLWSTVGRLDPPMWSLSVEVTFYALLPFAGWLILRRGPLLVTGLAVAAGLAWTAAGLQNAWDVPVMRSLPSYLPVFACGIAAAALAHKRPPGRRAALALLGAGSALVVANAWWHSAGTGLVGHVVLDLPAAVGFAAIVPAVAHRPAGLLATRPLRVLGDLSYGIYLWHYPVLLWWYLRGELPREPLDALAHVLVPTLAIAALGWWLVELPVLRWVHRARVARRRTPHATSQPQAAGAGGG